MAAPGMATAVRAGPRTAVLVALAAAVGGDWG